MDKKEVNRQQWNNRLSTIKRGLYDKSVYEVAKEQSRLERLADKLLEGDKKCTTKKRQTAKRNGNYLRKRN